MKRKFILTVVGVSVMLLSFVGAPAYGSGGGHGGGGHGGGFSGGGHAGFSGGGHVGGTGHGYSGAGISHGAGGYGASHYAPGISTGRYGGYSGYGQSHYAPRTSAGNPIYRSSPSSQSRTASRQFARSPKYSGSYYVPRDQSALALRANPASSNALAQLQRVQPGPTELGRDRMPPTGSDSTRKQNKGCVTGKAKHLDTPTQNVITRNTGRIASTMTMIGGVTIATLSFLLAEVFGVGMTAGGIRPGAMTRIIPTTITMVPIYGYDGLQPDEVIGNVQAVLQQLGYFPYAG